MEDKTDGRDAQQLSSNSTAKSWRVMLIAMLVFIPLNFLLPCGCVLRERDPRGFMLMAIAGAWMYHLICCGRDKKLPALGLSMLVGVLFYLFAFLAMPM